MDFTFNLFEMENIHDQVSPGHGRFNVVVVVRTMVIDRINNDIIN